MIKLTEKTYEDPAFQHLTSTLIDWINDELIEQRIIVKELDSDLYDGQVLKKLLEKLTDTKIDVPEVTVSEHGQRYKLRVILEMANSALRNDDDAKKKWTVDSIHRKDLIAILHLLVALLRHFRPAIQLPDNVSIEVLVPQKLTSGKILERIQTEQITEPIMDAFDSLFDDTDRLDFLQKTLVTFLNKHLGKLNLEVIELDSQFHDGVYLVLLMGLLEGFFTSLDQYHLTPSTFGQKVHNVNFAFELMTDLGVKLPLVRAESIVRKDLKPTLKVLWTLFLKYKDSTV